MKTPVALLIFKRPQLTEQVFEVIRQVKPPKLLVIADGPRPEQPDEAEKCEATRAIIDRVDWDCEVLKNYSEINLGCGQRPATGISWVFEQVETAIILEDDCLPHPSFFQFCEELLEKYRDEPRVMNICGSNLERSTSECSYYFSKYVSCWGWATWRRAWSHFDYEMKRFPEFLEKGWLYEFLPHPRLAQFWTDKFKKAYRPGQTNIWDYQWLFACWLQNGLAIRPNGNLISNLGFGTEATNTIANAKKVKGAGLPFEPVSFPLKHPNSIVCDTEADSLTHKEWIRSMSPMSRAYRGVRKVVKNMLVATQ